MRRGTTPTITIAIDDIDLTNWNVFLTFVCNGKELTKTNEELTIKSEEKGCSLTCRLSQADTLSWNNNSRVRVQIRATNGTDAIASDITFLSVEEILKDGEI